MKKIFLLIFILFIGSTHTALCQMNEGIKNKIDSIFIKFDNQDSPGFGVGIFNDSSILFQKGYGIANLEYAIPITGNTAFNVASLSKQFTAACIALLITRGQLSLEDNVSKYLDGFPDYKHEIKVKHLIYMTSGIKEYYTTQRENGLNWNPYNYFSIDTAIASSLKVTELEYEPGTKWTYSNINYMLLTKIVEKISGISFSQFANENLFIPLGMQGTFFNDDVTQVIKNRAVNYNLRNNENIESFNRSGMKVNGDNGYIQIHRNSPHYGGSGLYTTINDLFLWNKNFYTFSLGGKPFEELMLRREKFMHPKDNDAFGLVFGNYEGMETIWYEGGDLGASSYMVRFPKQKITIVCIANLGNAGAVRFANKIADILIEENILIK